MDWTDWYTDTADVFRNEKVTENSLTHMERRKVLSGVACRVYQTKTSGLQMNQTAADSSGELCREVALEKFGEGTLIEQDSQGRQHREQEPIGKHRKRVHQNQQDHSESETVKAISFTPDHTAKQQN